MAHDLATIALVLATMAHALDTIAHALARGRYGQCISQNGPRLSPHPI